MACRSPLFQSFIALLALVSSTLCSPWSVADACVTQSSPNPIAQQYPNLVSGTLNGTTLIVPIPLELARALIPEEYTILENAYRCLLPSFPTGMYPLMVTVAVDHDLQLPAYNVTVGDFSRSALEFPFLDILGNGYSNFRWAATMMITSTALAAITGSEGLGLAIYPSAFEPACDPYTPLPDGSTYMHSESITPSGADAKFMTVQTQASPEVVPYPLTFIRNVTNQPAFANTSACDNYIRLYNTTNSAAPHEPQPVAGTVVTNMDPLASNQTWTGVYGWNYATAFIEPPVPGNCAALANFIDS
ncbi:hypothetical protein PG994_013784 [Apiospora phragmitis]|uniref:Uncharacterized protein n=1 Tax=Apiospora phragmitis TaxID=2905665 RepID=A0ABR1T2V6_9PEZI